MKSKDGLFPQAPVLHRDSTIRTGWVVQSITAVTGWSLVCLTFILQILAIITTHFSLLCS